MSKSAKRLIKVFIQILKFAASQLDVFLKEEEQNEKVNTTKS
jgi:hypothetical protein